MEKLAKGREKQARNRTGHTPLYGNVIYIVYVSMPGDWVMEETSMLGCVMILTKKPIDFCSAFWYTWQGLKIQQPKGECNNENN